MVIGKILTSKSHFSAFLFATTVKSNVFELSYFGGFSQHILICAINRN